MAHSHTLDRYRVGHAETHEGVRQLMLQQFGVTRLYTSRYLRDFNATTSLLKVADIDLGFCAYSQPFRATYPGDSGETHVRAYMPSLGKVRIVARGSEWANVKAGDICTVPPGGPFDAEFPSASRKLFIRIPERVVHQLHRHYFGEEASALSYLPTLQLGGDAGAGFAALLPLLVSQVDAGAPQPIVEELAQSLTLNFLLAACLPFRRRLADSSTSASHAQVIRAEEFIDANLGAAFDIAALAEASGCSARSLFDAFKEIRGCPPAAFIKKRRLQKAKELLSVAEPSTRVGEVALACGFTNMGRFADEYARLFGERPSETLARRKIQGN